MSWTIEHTDTGTVYRDEDGTVVVWDRVLTDREVRMLLANPYQVSRPLSQRLRWWHRLARALRTVTVRGR